MREGLGGAIGRMQDAMKPWVERYRPESLGDVVAHEHIIATLEECIASNKVHHMIFYGVSGTGKTSTALAFARRYGGTFNNDMYVLELNGSDERGVGVIRDTIANFARARTFNMFGAPTKPADARGPQKKIVILDEADAMTPDAQNIVQELMDAYGNTKYIFICNKIHRMAAGIQSRCGIVFKFAPIAREVQREVLLRITAEERVRIAPDALELLIDTAGGDLRHSINVLQSVKMAHEEKPEVSREMLAVSMSIVDDDGQLVRLLFSAAESAPTIAQKVEDIRMRLGVSLQDMINIVTRHVVRDASLKDRAHLIDALARLELGLNFNVNPTVQLLHLIAICQGVVGLKPS